MAYVINGEIVFDDLPDYPETETAATDAAIWDADWLPE